jgi:energy-coupling factor transporter ATP-binding protein EcfA2
MLKSLRIGQFKSIYSAELHFGAANLFIGPNGAGKSNILEALGILSAAISKGLEPAILDDRGIRLSVPTMFKSAFKKTKLPQSFRLEAVFENGKYECSIRAGERKTSLEFHSEALYEGNNKIFGRGPNGVKVDPKVIISPGFDAGFVEASRSLWDVFSPFAKISDQFRSELIEFGNFSIYAPQTAIMRGVAVDPRVKEPLGLTGSGLATAFADVLNQRRDDAAMRGRIDRLLSLIWEPGWTDQIKVGAFDSQIVPSHIKSDGMLLYLRDRFMNVNRNFLSAFDASEGTLYLTFVAVLLAHKDAPSSFALDNVDGTLNPKLVRRLADSIVETCCDKSAAAASQKQCFVTSHHPSSLDSFDLFDESNAVFVAHRNLNDDGARGSTKFERIKPPPGLSKDEWADRSGGKNLSTLLLEGLIPDAL